MTQIKIFGKEPALIVGFIAAVVAVLAGLNLSWLSAGASVAIVAAVGALLTALTTRPVAPALFVGAFVAVAAVLAQYNYHLSDGLIAGAGGLILAAFALFGVRPQVTPSASPVPIAPATGNIR
jgi:cell division protein FtsW (lipid II flippase)